MTYKNVFISFLILAVTALALWTTMLSYSPARKTPKQSAVLPDALMESVNSIIMDKQGKPKMKIASPKMTHYNENDTTELVSPQLTIYRESPEPWYITSKFATATQGIEIVNFSEDVTIHHAADVNNPATLITTLRLTVHPNKQTAETEDPIVMTQPSMVVKAKGMQADMNSGNIKLLSQARGEYVPH